ncbi:MAG: glycosyltransferase family 2 protein [Proteobacteria bacterium]|nr:glycosyltransferase family 2 protein [Pseudomonadota bacterium]
MAFDTRASVDVLIPAYNAEQTIEDSMRSILAQTLTSIRVLVVDDGSSDGTATILKQLKASDSRIEIVQKENGGIVDALNLGLSMCTADYVARFDADDISFPFRLEAQRAYLEENSDCVAVGGMVTHIDAQGFPLHGLPLPDSPEKACMTWVPAIEPYLIHPFVMIRRASLQAVGGYRYVANSEDSDLYWRLSEHGRLHNLDAVLGKYRVHQTSISSASIVNSRVMAINSQLAAISAQRRRSGRPDLVFSTTALKAFQDAGSLQRMCALAAHDLAPEELAYLHIAASIKLLELVGYRPVSLELSDCRFIRKSLTAYTELTPQNKKEIDWYVTTAATRLLKKGRYREMSALLPMNRFHIVLARLIRGR